MQCAYSQAADEPVTGSVKEQLKHVFALHQNGSPDENPADLVACRKKVSGGDSKYLGMTATSALPSSHNAQSMDLGIDLKPLGVAGQYAFGAFRPTQLPDVDVLFSISTHFKRPKSSLLVINEGKKMTA